MAPKMDGKNKLLTIVRHGESLWNQENRFTGWQDVELSDKGRAEALKGGRGLKDQGLQFDVAFTSVLKRAIHTLDIVLNELDQVWLPVSKEWRLNERHYGGLTGLNKTETAQKHGEEQVKIWRRSFAVPPPPMAADDPRHPRKDPRYKDIANELLPNGESLAQTIERFLPLWNQKIVPALQSGQRVLVVAHGNSLRALIKNLESLSDAEIMELNMPTGIPLCYELGPNLEVLNKTFIGDPVEVAKAMAQVASQGKSR